MLTLSKNVKQVFKKLKEMYLLNALHPEAMRVRSWPGCTFKLAL